MSKFYRIAAFLCLLAVSTFFPRFTHAEGTRELRPTSLDKGYLLLGSGWSRFASYNADTLYRLHIQICNVGEKVYFGFKTIGDKSLYFRVKQPDGTDVAGFSHQAAPTSGNPGHISTYSSAVAGPDAVVGASGYSALSFTATTTGDYYIEFNRSNSTTYSSGERKLEYFDITVTDAGDVAIPGRVWSREWALTCEGFNNPFRGEMYMYSDDQIVTSIQFNDIKPFYFTITANPRGTEYTGDPYEDRKSKSGNVNFPQYKIYLNDPDPSCNPEGSYGSVTAPITVSGCDPDSRCINIQVDKAGSVDVILDLNGVSGYQDNTIDRLLSADVVVGDNCIEWDSRDGQGDYVASGTPMPVEVHYFNGITHMPMYDVENHENGYIVELHRPNTGDRPEMFWDDLDFASGTQELGGCDDSTGCHEWPFFCSGSCGWGNVRTINTWWYANIIEDNTVYNVETIFVDANANTPDGEPNDTTICSNNLTTFDLNGSVTGFTTTGQWTSLTGGTFDDDTDLQATYTFDATELSNGTATVVLTSTGNGACPAVTDTMIITIQDGPTIEAGPDQIKCENNPIVTLSGSVTVAGGATWSGGLGSYAPDENDVNAVYTPDASEAVASNTLRLYLTSTDNGICNPSIDSVDISFISSPTVVAGDPVTVCEDSPTATLNATFSGATGIQWVDGDGTYSSTTDPGATYTPSADEIDDGSVVLTIQTTGNGECLAEEDTVTVIIAPQPTVNAGANQIVCANNAAVTLSGSITNVSGATWTTSGDGTFDDDGSLTAVYTPGSNDISTESVTLTLTTLAENNCNAVDDDVTITITSAPQAQTGADQFKCENNPDVNLSGVITNATGGTWIGQGTFTPSVTDLNATYTPHDDEITAGVAVIILETTGNGDCVAEDDTMIVLFTPAPTVDAGNDISACENNPVATLTATESSGAASILWSGNGTFGSGTNLTTTYTPSTNDLNAGAAVLTVQATLAGCNPVTDDVTITYTDEPTVEAGSDVEVCANNADVTLNGSVTIATGGTWTTAGSGSFDDANSLTATYSPSAADTTAGSVTLYLTTTGSGNCNEVTDSMEISFTPAPTIDAGAGSTVCGNNATTTLSASVSVATGGSWSGGTGNFNPSSNNLSTSYTPSAAEISAGSATLTITSTGNGDCNAVTDDVTITITDAPTVDAGSAISVCENNPMATLAGSVTIATGGTWSGGNGTFSDVNDLNSTYLPTGTEISAGTVTLTLTTTGNGDCTAESDDVTITITPAPTVDAGGNQTVCGDLQDVNLNGTITVATGATWSHTGSGSLNDANLVDPTYTPDDVDTLVGSVQFTITTTGNGNCTAVSDQMTVTFQSVPEADAGPDQVVCTKEFPAQLNGNGSAAVWTSDGSGTFDDASVLNTTYTPSAADTVAGTVTLTLTTTANGQCAAVTDEMDITIPSSPIANAGTDQTVCADAGDITLNGSVAFATGGTWSTDGDGSFSNVNDLGATYTFSNDDIDAGTVNIFLTTSNGNSCSDDVDTMVLTITPAPTVSAGGDKTACADVDSIALNGQFTVAGGIVWTTSGTGTFSPNDTTDEAYYVPSPLDTIGGGPVTLTITTTDNGGCNAVDDDVEISFTPAPTVSTSGDVTVCADTSGVDVSGSVSVATGGIWSTGGTGVFSPSSASLSTTYVPSVDDTTAGTVTLYLTTTGNGTCKAVTDSLEVSIDPVPFVDAGTDQIVCGDSTTLVMAGSVQNATGGTWTTTGDGTFPVPTNLTGDYNVGTNDSTFGTVTLILTSTGSGTCADVSDDMLVTITPPPTVDAGPDQTVCAVNSGVDLNGSVSVATGGTWTTSGAGTFDDANSLSTLYHLDVADTTAGSVQLILTTTGNGTCNPVTDAVDITINSVPVVDAGADITVCSDTSFIDLNGSITGGIGGLWSSSGTGNFFPNAADLGADYVPTAADTAAGSIVLKLTTDGAAPCAEVSDSIVVTFTPAPTVEAGPNQTICADTSGLTLSGSVTVATGGTWTTTGTGIFSAPNDLAATYVPSSLDSAAGSVSLTLTTTGNGDCKEVSDFMQLTIDPAPTVSTVGDQTICASQTTVTLNGSTQVAGGVQWTTSGTGTFVPNTTTESATYTPSAADKTAGNVELVLTTTDNGLCNAVSDTIDLTITPIPTVDAGPDAEICGDGGAHTLAATSTNAGGIVWTKSGSGAFSNTTDPNAEYTPSAADLSSGTVVLTVTTTSTGVCASASDSLELTVTAPATVSAGDNQDVCDNSDVVILDGSYSNAQFATWTTSGSGTFDVDTMPGAGYTPSAADFSNGVVTLTYTATGNGSCSNVTDIMFVNFDPAPVASAGPDIVVCELDATVDLDGSFTNASGGGWATDGQGTFNPIADTNSTVTYTFDPADNDTIIMEFRAFGLGACGFDFDSLIITFAPSQTIDAGPASETVCGDTSGVQLNGSGSNGVWSGGAGTYSPDSTALNAVYKPTAAELSGGPLVLTLTSTSNGSCPAVTDDITLTFADAPTTSAGADITVCGDTSAVPLNATFNNATGGQWTTTGSGTFDDEFSAATNYVPSTQDIADSLVTLRFTTTGNNPPCDASDDALRLYITPAPTVNAGSNQILCADVDSVQLTGSFTVAGDAGWTTNGSGTFSPDTSDMNANYIPSVGDTTAGSIEIYLTTLDNGNCQEKIDTIDITLTPAPTVDAGTDETVCADTEDYALNADITVSTGGIWTTTGTGSFSPSPAQVDPTYTPSSDDTLAGSVEFIFTTTGNGNCKTYSDTLNLSFDQVPSVNAGADQEKCRNTTSVDLNGAVVVSATAGWTTTGTGSFAPDTADLAAVYAPTADDLSGAGLIFTLTSTDNGTCQPVTDVMVVDFNAAPTATVNAGFDQTVCSDIDNIDLTGEVTIASGGLWQTLGDGTFEDSTSLGTRYFPSTNDIAATSVTLVLETTGNGICDPEVDSMTISFTPIPTVDAGSDSVFCGDVTTVPLSGSFTVATGGIWSTTGSGTFSPNSADPSANYIPTDDDVDAGVVGFTFTTTGNGTCNTYQDDKEVTLTPIPTVDAGLDQTICADQASITMDGAVTVATGGDWSTSGTGAFGNISVLNTDYTHTTNDQDAGIVNMMLTTTGNGTCNPVTDLMQLTINPAPTVDAGVDQTVCANNATTQLNAVITVATGGSWSGGTGTFSPNASTLNATYTPSASEIAAGSATLVLTSTGNDLCNAVRDTVEITITPAPTVNAGDGKLCSDLSGTTLDGSFTVSTGVIWTTSGTGVFSPSAADTNALYTPSQADLTSGEVTLTLTTDGNGNCLAVTDEITVIVKDLPTADAGDDQTICRGDGTSLDASTFANLSYNWMNTDSVIIGTQASINVSNISSDSTFVLEVTDQDGCVVTDTMLVAVTDPPTFTLANQDCYYDTNMIVTNPVPAVVPGTYQWYKDGSLLVGETSDSLQPTGQGTYVIGYSFEDCQVFDTVALVEPQFDNELIADLCLRDANPNVTLDAGAGDFTYQWEDDLGVALGTDQTLLVSDTGWYFVTVTEQTTGLGCQNTDSMIVISICPPLVHVATAFIPSGSGNCENEGQEAGTTNDCFYIFVSDVENYEIRIFNRWGEVVFQSNDVNVSWDGTYLGELVPGGVYPWIITYESIQEDDDEKYMKKGSVTVVR